LEEVSARVEVIIKALLSILALTLFLSVGASYLIVDGLGILAYRLASLNVTMPQSDYLYFYLFALPGLLPITVTIPSPSSQLLFYTLLALYTLMLIQTFLGGGKDVAEAVKDLTSGRVREAFQNSFFSTASLTSAVLVASILIIYIQEEAGVPTGSIAERNPLAKYLWVSYAPLVEEIGFRVSIAGVILLLGYGVRRAGGIRGIPSILLQPSRLGYGVGEKLPGKGLLWISLFASTVVFSLTHFLYGGGWEVGKISQAALGGLLFSYLYLRFGLPSAIISHWTFNYFTETISILQDLYPILFLSEIALLALGTLTILYLSITLLSKKPLPLTWTPFPREGTLTLRE
jgi:hypothetical protein